MLLELDATLGDTATLPTGKAQERRPFTLGSVRPAGMSGSLPPVPPRSAGLLPMPLTASRRSSGHSPKQKRWERRSTSRSAPTVRSTM